MSAENPLFHPAMLPENTPVNHASEAQHTITELTPEEKKEKEEQNKKLTEAFFITTGTLSRSHSTGYNDLGLLDTNSEAFIAKQQEQLSQLETEFKGVKFTALEEIRSLDPTQKGKMALYIALKYWKDSSADFVESFGLRFYREGGSGRDKFSFIRQQQSKFKYDAQSCEFADYFLMHLTDGTDPKENFYEKIKAKNYARAVDYLSNAYDEKSNITVDDLVTANKFNTQGIVPERFQGSFRMQDAVMKGRVRFTEYYTVEHSMEKFVKDISTHIQTGEKALMQEGSNPDQDFNFAYYIQQMAYDLRHYDSIHPFQEAGGRTMAALFQVYSNRVFGNYGYIGFEPVGDGVLINALNQDSRPKPSAGSKYFDYAHPRKLYASYSPDNLTQLFYARLIQNLGEVHERDRYSLLVKKYLAGDISEEEKNYLARNLKLTTVKVLREREFKYDYTIGEQPDLYDEVSTLSSFDSPGENSKALAEDMAYELLKINLASYHTENIERFVRKTAQEKEQDPQKYALMIHLVNRYIKDSEIVKDDVDVVTFLEKHTRRLSDEQLENFLQEIDLDKYDLRKRLRLNTFVLDRTYVDQDESLNGIRICAIYEKMQMQAESQVEGDGKDIHIFEVTGKDGVILHPTNEEFWLHYAQVGSAKHLEKTISGKDILSVEEFRAEVDRARDIINNVYKIYRRIHPNTPLVNINYYFDNIHRLLFQKFKSKILSEPIAEAVDSIV